MYLSVLTALRLDRLSPTAALLLLCCICSFFGVVLFANQSPARVSSYQPKFPNVSFFSVVSGDQYRLPGLSRSTSPSPTSPHRRSASNSTLFGPGGDGNTAEFNHSRRRSGFVPVRALLLLSDWSIGHEVNLGSSRGPQVATTRGGYCARRRVYISRPLTLVISPQTNNLVLTS